MTTPKLAAYYAEVASECHPDNPWRSAYAEVARVCATYRRARAIKALDRLATRDTSPTGAVYTEATARLRGSQ